MKSPNAETVMDRLIFPQKKYSSLYHGLFALLVIALVIFKLNDLQLPYFWDELGVYGRGVDYQLKHGISLMPGSLPPELSRGHPLFFTFINAAALRVFGEHVFVAHLFCLGISIVLLWAVYIKTSKYFGQSTGLVSAILLALQPVFLAQSGLMLPEITLTLLAFLSITNYYEGNIFLFSLFASLALLTKESAIVLPVAMLTYSVVRFIFYRDNIKVFRPVQLFLTLVPYMVFGVFLLIQKKQNGWYFFPYHLDSVALDQHVFMQQLPRYFLFVSHSQGRYWFAKFILVAPVVALLTHRWNRQNPGKGFLLPLLIFAFAFLCFCCISAFFMDRYAMSLVLVFIILTGVCITTISGNNWWVAAATIFLCVTSWGERVGERFTYDSDLGYRSEVRALQEAVNYVEENSAEGEKVCGNFPAYFALSFPAGGYLPEKSHLVFDRRCDYYLSASPGASYNPDTAGRQPVLMKDFKYGYSQVAVYQLRKVK
jgi:4-amino-4-deoxy-L-arabinose transferase-like glycosyltransferase